MEAADIRLLADVGFLAAARGDLPRAQVIFDALELLRPEAAFPYVGQAVALLNRRRADDAVTWLDKGLRFASPAAQQDLQAIRGLALQLAGRLSESARTLKAAGDHPLANALLCPPGMARPHTLQ